MEIEFIPDLGDQLIFLGLAGLGAVPLVLALHTARAIRLGTGRLVASAGVGVAAVVLASLLMAGAASWVPRIAVAYFCTVAIVWISSIAAWRSLLPASARVAVWHTWMLLMVSLLLGWLVIASLTDSLLRLNSGL